LTIEKQAHWRELQILRKYFKAKRGNSLARMEEDYAEQINDIEGKLGLQVPRQKNIA